MTGQIASLYRKCGLWVQLYARLRVRLLPAELIARHLHGALLIVDLGCGYGLLANLLALHSPAWRVIGVDHSKRRIAQAMRTTAGRENIEFHVADAADFLSGADAFVMVDFLHHLHKDQQDRLLHRLHSGLPVGGRMVILEVPESRSIPTALSRAADWLLYPLSVKAQFRDPDEFSHTLDHIGFEVIRFDRPSGIFGGIGYACRKSPLKGVM
jgi:cyclopropane fatty-acyl-phospholipid synthase-like methyltransferase